MNTNKVAVVTKSMRRGVNILCLGIILSSSACFKSACASGQDMRVYQEPVSSVGPADEGEVPAGFMRMEVLGVLPTAEGNAVFLGDREQEVVLPIWIGASEAMAIQLRMERRRFERPLTHDLLDTLVKELGGRIVRIHVDDLRGSTFVATVIVSAQGRTFAVDARPSDAIAVAVGNRVPIFVAVDVVDRAGLGREDVPGSPFDAPPLEGPPPEGHQLRERDDPGIIGPPPTQSL